MEKKQRISLEERYPVGGIFYDTVGLDPRKLMPHFEWILVGVFGPRPGETHLQRIYERIE